VYTDDKKDVENEEEEDLSGSVWLPVLIEKEEERKEEIAGDPSIREMDLAQISEKEVYVRKADLRDFKKSIDNCKPTVHSCLLELYAKFLKQYGHQDQLPYVKEFLQPKQPNYLSFYA